jgi:hypothetical protein
MWGISVNCGEFLLNLCNFLPSEEMSVSISRRILLYASFSLAQHAKSGLDRRAVEVYTSHSIRDTHTHAHIHTPVGLLRTSNHPLAEALRGSS